MSPDTRVPITLTAAQWNAVLAMLAEHPYRQSAPLIQQIQVQCNQWDAAGGHEHDRGHSLRAASD